MIDERFIYVGAIFSLIGQISYISDTLKGRVKPNRVTWFLWAVIPAIALLAEIKQGVGLPVLMTFMVGFGPLLIFLASFINKKAYWKISVLDIICGLISILGVVLWQIVGSGNLAILFSIIADFVAGIPTMVKSYHAPESENYMPFLFSAINALLTLLALKVWNFAHYAFPLYILFACLVLIVLIKFRVGKILSK